MCESVASAGSAPPGLKIRTIASHVSDALFPYFSLDDVLTDLGEFSITRDSKYTRELSRNRQ